MKRIAILVEHHYQDMEVWYPYFRLKEEGFSVIFAGTGSAAQYSGKFGYPARTDKDVKALKVKDFDAVIVPGGWAPDFLRRYDSVLNFVRSMDRAGKVVASICHGGWVLASADILKGRTATSVSAIRDDVRNAGARFVDKEVQVDGNLITSRTPDDLPAFMKAVIRKLNEKNRSR